MWHRTKKEILEHLGKDGKDVRYLDRAVASGEIIIRDRMYALSREYIEELESENMLLKGKVDKNINQENKVDKNDNLAEMERKFKELESNLEYQMRENERLEKRVAMYQECIRNCYRWAQNVKKDKTPRPEFKEKVLKMVDELPWEDNQ